MTFTNLYAVDGKCHNSEAGSYGHECGKPAAWLGVDKHGWAAGYCDHCKQHGSEARLVVEWIARELVA
jgi:hypothetical protein